MYVYVFHTSANEDHVFASALGSLELGAWTLELGTGAWSLELGA
jgi:hypothetical protein